MNTIATIDLFAIKQRDAKGHFIKGNTVSLQNEGGQICRLCTNGEKIMGKVNLYNEYTKGKVNGKMHMPWLEQLCDEEYLNISDDTLGVWTNLKELDETRHSIKLHTEFTDAIARLFRRQRHFLKMAGLSTKNSSFHQFLLRVNHGMIETQREIQSGDPDNPITNKLEIEVIEAKRNI